LSKKLHIQELNKAFDNRVRLGIMTMLLAADWCDFGSLKDNLELTDGNLASHLKSLEEMEFVEVRKAFIGKKPNSSYRATKVGRKAFLDHLTVLQNIIKSNKI
jgi:DNA-binding HxlR family transcriptional regulator